MNLSHKESRVPKVLDHLVAEDDGEPLVFVRQRLVEVRDLNVDSSLSREPRSFLDGLDAVNLAGASVLCDADGQLAVIAAEIDKGAVPGERHESLDVCDVLVSRSLDSRSGPTQ